MKNLAILAGAGALLVLLTNPDAMAWARGKLGIAKKPCCADCAGASKQAPDAAARPELAATELDGVDGEAFEAQAEAQTAPGRNCR